MVLWVVVAVAVVLFVGLAAAVLRTQRGSGGPMTQQQPPPDSATSPEYPNGVYDHPNGVYNPDRVLADRSRGVLVLEDQGPDGYLSVSS